MSINPRTWAPARHVWKLLRAARGTVRRVPPVVGAPERFEALLDTVAKRGAGWLSDERPVAKILGAGVAHVQWAAIGEEPIVPSAWRWIVARDLVVQGTGGGTVARLAWSEQGGRAVTPSTMRWDVTADGRPHTYVVDLAATDWRNVRAAEALRFEVVGTATSSLGTLALVGDLAQLEEGDARWPLAQRYIRGAGIECGALQHPLRVPDAARVVYVDRLTAAQAREHYPELKDASLTSPHVVGDVQCLPIGAGRVDFYIGNHLLEHAQDAIAGLEEMLRVVRPGGVVYVSVPDARNPLDARRPVTPLAHHLDDHDDALDRAEAHRAHYREYVESAHAAFPPAKREAIIERFVAQGYSIHFHTFDEETFRALLERVCQDVGARMVEFVRNRGPAFDEYIAVLRRT